MGSQYDAATRQALQQAFRDGWRLLKERRSGQAWETHNDLKHDLSDRLMRLVDEGVELTELLTKAMEKFPAERSRSSKRPVDLTDHHHDPEH